MAARNLFRFVRGSDRVVDWLEGKILDLMAPALAALARRYTSLPAPLSQKYFRLLENRGVHITPVHFYQPIPDTRALPNRLWEQPSAMVGIELNDAAQLALLQDVFPRFRTEYDRFAAAPTDVPHEFHFNNGAFSGTDALVLYCVVRHFRPRLIIEVGSGFSSRVSARAALANGDTRLLCIEPHPGPLFEQGFPGMTKLLRQPVQEVDPTVFEQLDADDILFIDSSHVVTCGSDVNYLFLEVLPRLRPGVLVHVHDVFLPMEMPKYLLTDFGLFWNEQYLLQAFLTYNSEFEVLFANAYMGMRYPAEMRAAFPFSQPFWGGGSFWLRRKVAHGPRTGGEAI